MRQLNPIEHAAHALIHNRATSDFPMADFTANNPHSLLWKNAMREATLVWSLARAHTRAETIEEAAVVADGFEWSANHGALDKRQAGLDDRKQCAEAVQSANIAAAIRALVPNVPKEG
tara:strand:+ start:45115 stop:45468 length:354 start_codon:yes stop_codon:yes gene_type:complete